MLEVMEATLERGALVGGRYRLVRVLGEGGMGVVWEVFDSVDQQPRALKVVRAERGEDRRASLRLQREARLTAGLEHPHVARIVDVGELSTGAPYLVMELLRGETLRTHLARVGRLDEPAVRKVLGSVAAGVAAAHAQGVVHRDIKPENIFLTEEGSVKVLDFGIAKEFSRPADGDPLTTTGAMLGTLHYMAPEQIFGEADLDARADVWALGVVMVECLTGATPTAGVGVGQVLKAALVGPRYDLRIGCPRCSPDLVELVAAMLCRERTARPSMDEVIGRLRVGGQTRTPATSLSTAPELRVRPVVLVEGPASRDEQLATTHEALGTSTLPHATLDATSATAGQPAVLHGRVAGARGLVRALPWMVVVVGLVSAEVFGGGFGASRRALVALGPSNLQRRVASFVARWADDAGRPPERASSIVRASSAPSTSTVSTVSTVSIVSIVSIVPSAVPRRVPSAPTPSPSGPSSGGVKRQKPPPRAVDAPTSGPASASPSAGMLPGPHQVGPAAGASGGTDGLPPAATVRH